MKTESLSAFERYYDQLKCHSFEECELVEALYRDVKTLALDKAKAELQISLLDGAIRRAIRLLSQVDKKYQDTTLSFCATLLDDCLRGAGLTPELAPPEPKDAA